MDLRKLFLPTLLGGFGMWVMAGLWHNLIMANLYESVHATHDGIGILLLAYVVLALLMSYLYLRSFDGGNPITEGMKLGAIIGVLWVFPHGLAMAGAHGDSISYVFKNAAWHIIEQGLGGVIIGFVCCKSMKHLGANKSSSNGSI